MLRADTSIFRTFDRNPGVKARFDVATSRASPRSGCRYSGDRCARDQTTIATGTKLEANEEDGRCKKKNLVSSEVLASFLCPTRSRARLKRRSRPRGYFTAPIRKSLSLSLLLPEHGRTLLLLSSLARPPVRLSLSLSRIPVEGERFSRRKNFFFAAIESEFLISFQRRRNRRRCTAETGGILARQFWRASFWCPSWRPSAGGYRVSPAFTRHESPSHSRGGCVSRAAPHHRKPVHLLPQG